MMKQRGGPAALLVLAGLLSACGYGGALRDAQWEATPSVEVLVDLTGQLGDLGGDLLRRVTDLR